MSLNLICWTKSGGRTPELGGPRGLSPGGRSRGEKMVAIFTLFCIVFIDSGNKHKILNKMTWKLPVWASHFFPFPPTCNGVYLPSPS